MKPLILIVDDDHAFSQDLEFVLQSEFTCVSVHTGAEGLRVVREQSPAAVLLDMMIGPSESGLDVLVRMLSEDENLPVIMITGHESVDAAVEAMRRGALSYISKRAHTNELVLLLQKAIAGKRVRERARTLAQEQHRDYIRIVGTSPPMQTLNQKIDLFANSPQTVLITGESGTGKELVARQIHLRSDRADRPFVTVNCAAIPPDRLEIELFGQVTGSSTGVQKRKPGKIEAAADGVVFFDEIGELDLATQGRLLRVLELREFERVAGVQPVATGVRVIAATNRDLHAVMKTGDFRTDLFHRLETLSVHVPPLRDRKSDIPFLINHFLSLAGHEMKVPPKQFTREAVEVCQSYSWPGNIRELRYVVASAAIMTAHDVIDVDSLNPHLSASRSAASTRKTAVAPAVKSESVEPLSIPELWEEMNGLRKEAEEAAGRAVETAFLKHLLERHQGNVAEAARETGINRSNLYRMMKRCGLA
ncbi:MAG: sigma-54 dependent transcriptional regulator [bacterium]